MRVDLPLEPPAHSGPGSHGLVECYWSLLRLLRNLFFEIVDVPEFFQKHSKTLNLLQNHKLKTQTRKFGAFVASQESEAASAVALVSLASELEAVRGSSDE